MKVWLVEKLVKSKSTIAIDIEDGILFTLSLILAQNSRLFVLSTGKHDSAYIKDEMVLGTHTENTIWY